MSGRKMAPTHSHRSRHYDKCTGILRDSSLPTLSNLINKMDKPLIPSKPLQFKKTSIKISMKLNSHKHQTITKPLRYVCRHNNNNNNTARQINW